MLSGTHIHTYDYFRTLMHFGEGVVLADLMRADGISHIHAHYASQPTSVARVVHLLLGIPYSFTGHAQDIWRDKILLQEKLEEAAFVVSCSELGRQSLLREAKGDVSSKVHLVYHGLDVRRFIPPKDDGVRKKNLILSVGRLTEKKGFSDLIKACGLLRRSGFPFECVIVGEGEMQDELTTLIGDEDLRGCVRLAGAVPQEKILEMYHSAWVFVLPCIDTRDGNRDGLPNVIMEAMATGVPVITTTNSAQCELIRSGSNGLLVPPSSPPELAKAVRKLCLDDELRQRIQANARQTMENRFDQRVTIVPLLQLFDKFVFSKVA